MTDGFPSESDAAYRLTVDGRVDHPMVLTLATCRPCRRPGLVRDFQCVTGWRVPKVHWQGVALSVLLDRAGVQPSAKALRFESFDGLYTESLTLAEAYRPDVIAAYSMLGGPVSREHGGPGAPLRGAHVRLQVAQVDVEDRGGRPGRARLLGDGGQLRRRGMGGAQQWPQRPGRPDDAAPPGALLVRFDRVERAVHWVNAALFLVLVATGAILYLEPLQAARRAAGPGGGHPCVCRPGAPDPVLLVALSGSWGRALRADLRRFNRWTKDDRAWLQGRSSRPGPERAAALARRSGSGSSTPARSSTPPSSPGPAW